MEVLVQNVSIHFGDLEVLSNFSARFAPGRVTALVGPSGSGKSTLLACIAGYLKPTAGQIVMLDDNAGTDLGRPVRPEYAGWVPQGANALGPRSVIDNVMIGVLSSGKSLATATQIAQSALDKVGLGDRAYSPAREMSGGELQRIAFARALASGRPLILADEPTSSLDARNTGNIVELLHNLRSTSTVIVASHDPAVVDAVQDRVELREA